jgi:hypothetical protein
MVNRNEWRKEEKEKYERCPYLRQESIRAPNFGNLSERKDLSMQGMFLKLKIGNRKLKIKNERCP